jgi:hypothetical protein
MSLHSVLIALGALLPSAGVGFLFFVIIKAMIEGDRRERLAHSRWEAERERSASHAKKFDNTGKRDSNSRESSRRVER